VGRPADWSATVAQGRCDSIITTKLRERRARNRRQSGRKFAGNTMANTASESTERRLNARPTGATGWIRWIPGVQTLMSYQLKWLRYDITAGLVMTTMLVPVGIAYAEASGLPGITGLYATIVPLLAYAVFGPSRILVLGPDSALAPLILTVVQPLSGGDPRHAIAIAGMMAVISGFICIVAGLARFGFITELLSKPIRYGYMNGIALTVLLSQVPKLLGFSVKGAGPVRQAGAIVQKVLAGDTNLVSFAVGGGALLAIVLLKRWPRVPGVLIAVVGATVAVDIFNLSETGGLTVLGILPRGLPAPSLPLADFDNLEPILMGSLAVALVAFADTSVLSRVYATRLRTPVDPNQEMVGLGIANLSAAFFQGFPICSSSSRTPVAEAAGSKTQLTGVVGAIMIALLLFFAPQLLQHLPNAALAAVVIAAAIGLFEVSDLRRIYRVQQWEFWLSMACFAGVAIFGAIQGIALAIVIAVIEFLWDGWRPHSAILGQVERLRSYHDVTRYPEARLIPGLVIFRWDAPLFFANAELFNQRVLGAIAASSTPVRRLVVAAEPVTSVDVTAADGLSDLEERLQSLGIKLCFAEMKDPVKDKLKRFGLYERIGEGNFYATVGDSVDAYVSENPRGSRD
jgi:high affinity sulfate transporter 1